MIDRPGILNPKVGDPMGHVTNDGMWAAIPNAGNNGFAIIHNGKHVHKVKTYKQALAYIKKQSKIKKVHIHSGGVSMTEKEQKRKDAFFIFYESVLKPDPELRLYAHDEQCFHELMEWRQEKLLSILIDAETRSLTDVSTIRLVSDLWCVSIHHCFRSKRCQSI